MNRARNNGIYAAETILKQRTKDGKVWYLMKWKGYSPRFNTWEPEENVLDDRLLKAYRKRLSESKGKLKRKRNKQVEEEGNPSDERNEIDVDIETTEATTEAIVNEQDPRQEIPDIAVEQPAESMRKWRKRRKPNTDAPTENEKDVSETEVVAEPSACTNVTAETTDTKEKNDTSDVAITPCSPEPKMTELIVDIPDDEHTPKRLPASPALEEAINSLQQAKPFDTPPSSSTSLEVACGTDVPSIAVHNLVSPPLVSPKRLSPNNTCVTTPAEEHKPDIKNVPQPEKKNILSKSSHFDFLANSIIITDVTTERGTVTVKECSAYGDFFGPDIDKS